MGETLTYETFNRYVKLIMPKAESDILPLLEYAIPPVFFISLNGNSLFFQLLKLNN